MRMMHLVCAFLVTLASAATAQTAQTQPAGCPHQSVQRAAPPPAVIAARKAEHQACATDMTKFCANVPRGCGRPMQCLRAHKSQLSPACTGAMAQLHTARVQMHTAPPAGQH